MIDPATGLPTDENGNILGAAQAGSNVISESDADAYHPAAMIDPPMPEAVSGSAPQSTPELHPAANVPVPGESKRDSKQLEGSYRGITQSGLAATTSLNKKADAAARADVNQFAPQYEEQAREAERVAQERRQGLALETQAVADHANEESKLWQAQQHFAQERAELEKHAYAQSQVVRQQYLANYEQDLNIARTLAMQTGDPYERMSGPQAFGLIAAHVVQGFLKVGGVNIDVADQTNRWVDREIAKHQQRIQNARETANDQLHLYDLARQNAADDYEARQRYTGMVMEGMKAQLQAEGARFNSQLANATAAQKSAEVDANLLAVKTQLADKMQATYFNAQKMRIDQAHQQAQDSVAWYTAKTGRMAEDRLKNSMPKPNGNLDIPDPGATIRKDGKVIGVLNGWRINKNASETQQNEANKLATEEGGKYATIKGQLDKLRELRAPAQDTFMTQYGPDWSKYYDEAYRKYRRQKDMIGESVVNSFTGAAAPESQMKRLMGILADDNGFQSGSNASGIDQLESYFRTQFVEKMNSAPAIEAIPENERTTRAYTDLPNDTDASYDASVTGKPPVRTPVDKTAGEAVQSDRREPSPLGGASPSFREYMAATKDTRGITPDGQRREIDAIDQLSAYVSRPDAIDVPKGQAKPSPDEVRQAAYKALVDIASGNPGYDGKKPDEWAQAYAAFRIQKLSAAQDPAALFDEVNAHISEDYGTPGEQLTNGTWDRRQEEQRTKERGDFLRKGITGE